VRIRSIGPKHTALESLGRGFPSDKKGEANEAARSLIRSGYITLKPTSYGQQVSINPKMIDEIDKILRL
jgi:hypothetical protein